MKTRRDFRNQSSQPQSTSIPEYRKEEIEKVNRALESCKAKGTSTYLTVKGKTYLITPNGVMSYEGTTTVAYSQSKQYREMSAKNEEKLID